MDERKLWTWREFFAEARKEAGDESPVIAVAPDEAALDVRFDPDYGSAQGPAFTIWTENRVYFPGTYDGAEWMASVSRNPDGEPTHHVGGG